MFKEVGFWLVVLGLCGVALPIPDTESALARLVLSSLALVIGIGAVLLSDVEHLSH